MLFLNTSLSLTSFKLNRYNPLINYDWSTTTTSGLRYLKDIGSTPTYNASMYFGRGAYLNGVDQTITVPIKTTVQTALKRVNGLVTINETSQTLTNYVISGLGVHKDYYLFTRLLTTAEKDSYTNTPELFYAMAQADSTCVLNMPMCETDSYARNMKSYSEGNNLILNSTFDTDVLNWTGSNATILSVNGQIEVTGTATVPANQSARSNLISSKVGKKYLLECNITQLSTSTTGFILSGFTFDISGRSYYYPHTIKKYYLVITATGTLGNINLHSGTAVGATARFDNVYVKEVTGMYPITNYTSSVRDNAKNLQYGLQTCKFVRDSLGVIQSASDYLVCDGVGYGNTGNYIDSLTDFSMEFIGLFKTSSTEQAHGVGYYNAYNRITFSIDVSGKLFSRCGGTIFTYSNVSLFNVSNYLTLTFVRSTKIFKLYLNGNYVEQVSNVNFISTGGDYTIGSQGSTTYAVNGDIRLLKVHNKVLTQEEVTKNYNSYVAKGLLS